MAEIIKPDKHKVRTNIDDRTHPEQDDSPPTPDDIRRELGWGSTSHNDDANEQT